MNIADEGYMSYCKQNSSRGKSKEIDSAKNTGREI